MDYNDHDVVHSSNLPIQLSTYISNLSDLFRYTSIQFKTLIFYVFSGK